MASFIDSNILVYAEASDGPVRQSAALAPLCRLRLDSSGILSTQELQEFANVALRKVGLDANPVRKQLSPPYAI